ncbi:putative F-box/kelch-repeat protein [Abeliophyllum distichum]|uniref:F-box/kelch-repeat protein n=1 Tax=Abeliophyllum distichum TaxID=126358 RepID=A0ABD1Q6R6_9LAMI
MAELIDDLVLEVISWLPLKDAVQCKILNTTFNAYISNRNFEHKHFVRSNQKICNLLFCSNSHPVIFRQLELEHPYPVNKLQTIDKLRSQIVSCGGLLLLYHKFSIYRVLNPLTRDFRLVPQDKHDGWFVGSIGLAVYSSTDSYKVTLVAVHVKKHQTCLENQVCKFTLFRLCSTQWEESGEKDFVCKSSEFVSRNTQSVYLHDSLHWVREDGSILAFDLEKCQARIIQAPVKLITGYDIWFGGIEGSIVFVCSLKSETVVYVYDHVHTNTWQIRHKIRKHKNNKKR